jgi:hypothetical protein
LQHELLIVYKSSIKAAAAHLILLSHVHPYAAWCSCRCCSVAGFSCLHQLLLLPL